MDYLGLIDLIGPVIVAVKLAIDQYQAIRVLKKETKEYRNMLECVLDLLTDLKVQQQEQNHRPTSLTCPLDLIRDAVQDGMEVFELCSQPTKRLQAFVMSKTYLNKLNASASKIREALGLLSGAGVALQGAIQDTIQETQETINSFQAKVMLDTTHITNELGGLRGDVGQILAILQKNHVGHGIDDLEEQRQQFLQNEDCIRKEKYLVDDFLIDAVKQLTLLDTKTEAKPAPQTDTMDRDKLLATLLCPISQEIMSDPVNAGPQGVAYDRASIYQSLIRYPDLCPATGVRHDAPLLVTDNLVARHLLTTLLGDQAYTRYTYPGDFAADYAAAWRRAKVQPVLPVPPSPLPPTPKVQLHYKAVSGGGGVMFGDDNKLRVWDLASGQSLSILHGHTHIVKCCTVYDQGRKALSGADDCTLRVWDLASGQTLSTLHGHTNLVMCCIVYDQDRKALSASWDKTLRVWDLASGQSLSSLHGHTGVVKCSIVYDQDRKALSASRDKTLRVWDLSTGQSLSTLHGHTNHVNCCTVYDQDRKALSGSFDNTLRVWDLASGQTLLTLHGHTSWVMCCTVYDQDRKAISASWDKTLRVWDLASGQSLSTLHGHTNVVNCCIVYDQDRKALSASFDKTLRVWDLATGESLHTLRGHNHGVYCCAVFH
jgi:uncharacterized membrane protein